MFADVISQKETTFHMTLQSAIGQPTCCLLMLCLSATNHRPHIGCQFSVVGLYATPCGGVASRALGLWWCTETKVQTRSVDDVIFIDWTQAWSMKTLNFGSKGSTRMNIQLSNDYDT